MHVLEKPKDLATRVGIPVSTIRHLIRSKQLDHVFITPGKRNPLVPEGAWERYINDSIIRAATECRNNDTHKFTEAKDVVPLGETPRKETVRSADVCSATSKPVDGGS